MVHYQSCPVCQSAAIENKLSVTDLSVSKEVFAVWQCAACSLRFTQNVPGEDAIAPYYRSEAYISHTDTRKGLINRLYHSVRSVTLRKKRKLVQKVTGLKKGNMLDIGAGTGAFLFTMQQSGWQITGLEPDPVAADNAKKNYGLDLQPPSQLFALPANGFYAITMWHVLEHVHQLEGYMRQLHQLLKQNGRLFIAVPNYTSKDATIYGAGWAAYDVPRHLYHFSPQSMHQLAQRFGFTIEKIKPMWFDAFYVAMLSEKYRNGSLFRAFWNGLRSNVKALFDKEKCSSVIYILRKKD
jgi:2-polyprenyl-3-methyl-5-hydroxy-6-metoxy-1,4-benzoquinol methylase